MEIQCSNIRKTQFDAGITSVMVGLQFQLLSDGNEVFEIQAIAEQKVTCDLPMQSYPNGAHWRYFKGYT